MKKTLQHLLTFALILFFLPTGKAQESTYTRSPGYWTLGINGGLAYQQGDVPTEWDGWGLGVTLAKNLYYQPGALFSFDARGRFLYNQTYGLDHAQSFGITKNDALNGQRVNGLDYTAENGGPGFVYQNHRTEMGELALEGVLNFNRLREQTNIILSVYGGIGLDLYQTKIDQSDFDGLYDADYLALDPRGPVSFRKSFLRDNILDGDYETNAQGFEDGAKIGFMPDLGIELGYQFTPRFSMGIGHKLTFPRNDLLDGQKWKNDNLATGKNDLHHYTNLHLRWIIDAAKKQKLQPPLIQITRPIGNPYTTRENYADIGAKILRVNSPMDITCTVNGNSVAFNFQREFFSLYQTLSPGNNEVVITASNSAGRDRKILNIVYEESIVNPPNSNATPRVNITNPPNRNYTSNTKYFELAARIDHVNNKRALSFKFNGQDFYNFDFDPANGQLRADLQLEKGRNYVQIKASTRGGTDEDDAIIVFEKKREENYRRPNVNITKPSNNPYRTRAERVRIEARIDEVSNKRNISLRLNGRNQQNFSFDGRVLYAEVYLQLGENDLLVEAKNNAGRDSDRRVLILDQVNNPPQAKPVVNFSRPSQVNSTSSSQRYEIKARVRNVAGKGDIRYYLNGSRVSNFTFNNEILTHTVTLRNGSNTVTIEATNRVGSDKESVTIKYNRVVINTPKPPIVTITRPSGSSSNSAKISLEATVQNVTRKEDISLSLNGRTIGNFSFNSNTNKLTASLTLNNGRNTIIVKATNREGSDQDSKSITYARASNPPQVTITRPAASSSNTPTVSLEAKALNVGRKSDINVTLNGRTISNFTFNTKTKIINSTLTLNAGSNAIIVKATNADGSDQDSKSITYNRASNPPKVTITKPTASNTQSPIVNLQAKILNMSSQRGIGVLLNGKSVSSFGYDSKTKILTAALKLRVGNNTIIVKATNADGSDQDSKSMKYTLSALPPVVVIKSPTNKSKINAKSTLVRATINNVTDKKKVRFYVNGKLINNFIFSGTSFSGTAPIIKGENKIKITASNADGSDEASVVVIGNPPTPLAKPTVKFVTPARPGATVTKNKLAVKVNVKNISAKSQITFKVNGAKYPTFNFNARTGVLTASLTLKSGATNMEVIATNATGNAKATSSVIYKVQIGSLDLPPTIKLISASEPTIDPFNPDQGKSSISASTTNITKKSQITFTVNGKAYTGFNFNTKTKKITAVITVNRGQNEVIIKVRNGAGQDEIRKTVDF